MRRGIIFAPLSQFMLQSSPLGQFIITGFSFPISSFITTVPVQLFVIILIVLLLHGNLSSLIPTRWSLLTEVTFSSATKVVKDQITSLLYLPLLYGLFLILLLGNLYGNLPHSYALTASAVVSLGLSVFVFIAVTALGVSIHRSHFLSFFVPEGTPTVLKPLLFIIELVSYASRSISLGTRLIANITAGHTLIFTCSGILISLISANIIGILLGLPLVLIFLAITGLELAVSFIQAFIFLLLTASYLKDSIQLH